jgi:hypothetical protein
LITFSCAHLSRLPWGACGAILAPIGSYEVQLQRKHSQWRYFFYANEYKWNDHN